MASLVGDAQDAIILLCSQHADGVTQAQIDAALLGTTAHVRLDAMNVLLQQQRLQLWRDHAGRALFRDVGVEQAIKFRNLRPEELMVYQNIKASDNAGLWTKDLKTRTNLQQAQLTKILRELEKRQLVKAVKSVASANRKVYMAFETEPAREITGGAWYTEHEYDEALIKTLRATCLKFIETEHDVSLQEVATFIRNAGFLQVELTDDDIKMVIDTLEYDGLVENIEGEDTERFRRSLVDTADSNAFTDTPCGVCPVINECTPGGVISPSSCQYYDKWLDF